MPGHDNATTAPTPTTPTATPTATTPTTGCDVVVAAVVFLSSSCVYIESNQYIYVHTYIHTYIHRYIVN